MEAQENLAKLSVKELKSLARKSNVNPNFKKAELIMALSNNIKITPNNCDETYNAQPSRRMTRSRVSMWQASEELSDHANEVKPKSKHIGGDSNSSLKDSVGGKKTLRKKERVADVIDEFDASEMFPLVSSIKLASKPLKEITNNELVRVEQSKDESTAPSKKSMRKKSKNQINVDVLSTERKGESSSSINRCLAAENDKHEDSDLTKACTGNIERQQSTSPDVSRKSKKSKRAEKEQIHEEQNSCPKLSHDQLIINESYDSTTIGVQKDQKTSLVEEGKSSPEKPKRGRKRKSESSLLDTKSAEEDSELGKLPVKESHLIENTQVSNKRKKRKGNEVKAIDKFACDLENSEIKDLDPVAKSEMSTSNRTEYGDSIKTKTKNHSPPKNGKRKKGERPLEKRKRIKNEVSDIEHDTLNSQEITGLVETALENSFGKLQVRNKSLNNQNEQTVMNTIKTDASKESLTNKDSISNGDVMEGKATPSVQGETGQKSAQGPVRSSTFILSDSSVSGQVEEMPVPAPRRDSTFILCEAGVSGQAAEMPVPGPRRDSTFILCESDGRSPHQRKSLRFSPGQGKKIKTSESPSCSKLENSIGHRIMKSSTNQENKKPLPKEHGSAVKKIIVKNTRTGSMLKKSGKKLPNFKKIHEQLFNNMESLSDHKKRLQERARGLMSPLSHGPKPAAVTQESPRREDQKTQVKTPVVPSPLAKKVRTPVVPSPSTTKVTTPVVPSPLATKVKTPLVSSPSATKAKSPVVPSPLATKLKTPKAPFPLATKPKTPAVSRTPVAARKPVPAASSVNRFGFRKPVKKEEATSIIGKKLPSVNTMDKKKEQERNVLKGVRMNKRFMLQMQMRQMGKNN